MGVMTKAIFFNLIPYSSPTVEPCVTHPNIAEMFSKRRKPKGRPLKWRSIGVSLNGKSIRNARSLPREYSRKIARMIKAPKVITIHDRIFKANAYYGLTNVWGIVSVPYPKDSLTRKTGRSFPRFI